MSDVELKARKAAADFVNACFTDLESLDKVKDVYDDVYKVHETCRQQLDEHVILGFSFMLPYRLYFVLCRQRSYFVYDSCGLTLSRTGGRINICTYFVFKTRGSMKISRRNPCSPFFSVSYSINGHKIL